MSDRQPLALVTGGLHRIGAVIAARLAREGYALAIHKRSPGEAERRYEMTLMPLQEWQIFYSRGGAWTNPLSSTGTSPAGTPALPDGVRLQITLPPGQALAGRLTRDWVNPVLGGGRS